MAVKLAELAVRYGCELRGDPEIEVDRVDTLQSATSGSISFLSNPAYRKYLATTKASVVILDAGSAEGCEVACLVSGNPYADYAAIAAELYPVTDLRPGVHPRACVDAAASIPASCEVSAGAVIEGRVQLGERVYIGPGCVIAADSAVGSDSRLLANVCIYGDVRVGERCIIHAGAVIGADGFGIAQTPDGWRKVPQVGGVSIGNDVEIGANTTVDRGAIEDTCLADGVKLDNLVQIAHNVRIGEHTAIAAQSGVAGSTVVGARCIIGGGVSISGHLTVGDDVYLMGRASVSKSLPEPGTYSSAIGVEEAGKWRKLAARFKRLDNMARKLAELERKLMTDAKKGS